MRDKEEEKRTKSDHEATGTDCTPLESGEDAALEAVGRLLYDELFHAGFSAIEGWENLSPEIKERFKDCAEGLLANWDILSKARIALKLSC